MTRNTWPRDQYTGSGGGLSTASGGGMSTASGGEATHQEKRSEKPHSKHPASFGPFPF